MGEGVMSRISRIVNSRSFDYFFGCVIGFSALLLWASSDAPETAAKYSRVFNALDILVLGLFTGEIVMRFLATGPRPSRYLLSFWNLFDNAIVLPSLVLLFLGTESDLLVVVRVLRLLRLVRIARVFPALQMMVGTLVRSLGYVGGAGVLLFGTLFLFGAIGKELFGGHDPAHFGSITVSILTLWGAVLGGWLEMMDELRPSAPLAALVYFPLFGVVATVLLYNLVIGAVVKAVDEESEARKTRIEGGVSPDRLEAVRKHLTEAARLLEEERTQKGR